MTPPKPATALATPLTSLAPPQLVVERDLLEELRAGRMTAAEARPLIDDVEVNGL